MTTTKLHRWALLDKKGKNRGTCNAESLAMARAFFASANARPIPVGWKVVKRGNAPAPVSLQEGGRVRRGAAAKYPTPFDHTVPLGALGTIVARTADDATWWVVVWDKYPYPSELRLKFGREGETYQPHELESVGAEATSTPTDTEMLAAGIKHEADLARQFQEALGLPEGSWLDLVEAATMLPIQIKRYREDLAEARKAAGIDPDDDLAVWIRAAVESLGEAVVLNGALADLRAIYRVAELIPNWDPIQMDDAVRAVLSRLPMGAAS